MTSPSSDPIGVAVVGYGLAGQTFHAPLISATPGVALRAVVSSRSEAVHADWPQVEVLPDLDAALSRNDIGLIVIGFVVAFISALAVVRFLLDFVSKRGFGVFAWWRIAVGVVGLVLLQMGF